MQTVREITFYVIDSENYLEQSSIREEIHARMYPRPRWKRKFFLKLPLNLNCVYSATERFYRNMYFPTRFHFLSLFDAIRPITTREASDLWCDVG